MIDWYRVQEVLQIALPVFAMMAVGWGLRRWGFLTEARVGFINALVYNFALPALIFPEIAAEPFAELLNPVVIVPPAIAVVIIAALLAIVGRGLGHRGAFAAAFVYTGYWANTAYIGFPLVTSTFGNEAMTEAGIYNGFLVPAFILSAYALIGLYGAEAGGSWRQRFTKAVFNPVVGACLLGLVVSLAATPLRGGQGELAAPGVVHAVLAIGGAFLDLAGQMGLPLALLAIGASLHFGEIRKEWLAVAIAAVAQCVLFPLVTLAAIAVLFPGATAQARGVTVLLAATPAAVASYVVSRKIGAEEGYVSSVLVASTLLSVLTLPAWLYVVLP